MGKFLRRTGFDELVQLNNVLKEDMSLVDPLIILPYQIKKYSDFQKKKIIVQIRNYWLGDKYQDIVN